MAYVLTVKVPGQPTKHYVMEKKIQANYNARRIGARLPKGGTIDIFDVSKGPPRLIGGLMKVNPRRRRRR